MKKKFLVLFVVLLMSGVFVFSAKAYSLSDMMNSIKNLQKQISDLQVSAEIIKAINNPAPTNPPQSTGCQSNQYLSQFGSFGTGNGQFNQPNDIVFDTSGNIYVNDIKLPGINPSLNNRVQKFDSNGTYVDQTWLTTMSSWGLDIFPNGNLLAVDQGGNRVIRYNWGSFISQWGNLTPGSGVSSFSAPTGVAVSAGNTAYISDSGNNRIQKIGIGAGEQSLFLSNWGTTGAGKGQFLNPTGVAVDASGNVYVSDTGNYRIQKFTANGTFVFAFGWGVSNGASQFQVCTNTNSTCQAGIYGAGEGQFNQAKGIAVDSLGNIYVADTGNNRIQKFNSVGAFVSSWGGYGSAEGLFIQPRSVEVDASGNVFVADTLNHRIQKFSPSCPVTPPPPYSCSSNSIIGDINASGRVDSTDALLINKISSGAITAPINNCCADINNDNAINASDALMALKYFLKMPGTGYAGQLCSSVN